MPKSLSSPSFSFKESRSIRSVISSSHKPPIPTIHSVPRLVVYKPTGRFHYTPGRLNEELVSRAHEIVEAMEKHMLAALDPEKRVQILNALRNRADSLEAKADKIAAVPT